MKLIGKTIVVMVLGLLVWPSGARAGSWVATLASDFAANGLADNLDTRGWQATAPGWGPLADGELILRMEWERVAAFPGAAVSDLEVGNAGLYAVLAGDSGAPVYVNKTGEFKRLADVRPGADFTDPDDERGTAFLQRFSRGGSDRLYATGGAGSTRVRALNEAGDGFIEVVDAAELDTGVTGLTALGDYVDLFGDAFLMVGTRGGNAVSTIGFEGRNWLAKWDVARYVGGQQVDFITGHEGFCYAAARHSGILAQDKFRWLVTAADWGAPIAMLASARFPGAENDLLLVGHEGANGGNLVRYARGRVYNQGAFRTYAAETTPLGGRVVRTCDAAPLGNDVYVVGNTDRNSGVILKYYSDYDAWKVEMETAAADRFFTAREFTPAAAAAAGLYVGGRAPGNGGIIYRGRYPAKGSFQSSWKEVGGDSAARVEGDTVSFIGCLHESDSVSLTLEVRTGNGRAVASGPYTLADRDAVIEPQGNRVMVSWPYRPPRGSGSAFTGFRCRVELASGTGASSPSIDSVRFDYHEAPAAPTPSRPPSGRSPR